MAVLAAAQLLDELMGRNRNVAPNEKVKELNWEDTEYCKFFMVKFCPHDLFVNTRADLGPCAKTHDEEARKLFQDAKRTHHRKLQYMEDFVRFCSSMISEVDRKIVKGKQRLALSSKNTLAASNPAQAEKNQEKIDILNERINELEKEAEMAGTEGNVEQAQGLMKLCDQLKEERDNLKQPSEAQWSATTQLAVEQEKQMEVCEVCGAFLIVGDAQQRIDDHLMGKQHMGYTKLKRAVEEIASLLKESKDIRKGVVKDNKSDREKERERDRDRRKEKDKIRERSRSGQRDKDKDREKRERERRRMEERERRERDREPEGFGRDSELVRESKLRGREREKRHHDREVEGRHRHHHHGSHRHRH